KPHSPTSWESVIASGYGSTAFDIAYGLDDGKASDVPAADKMYRIAIRLDPTRAAAYNDLGLLLYHNHGAPSEVITMWTKYRQLQPDDPQAPAIRKALTTLQARS